MNIKCRQRSDENWFDYANRLIENKNLGLYDLDKVEIYEYLTGEQVSHDHARKMLCFLEKILEKRKLDIADIPTSEDVEKKTEEKLLELQKERYKLQTLRLDLNKTVRETSRSELKVEEFIQEMKRMMNDVLPEFEVLQKQDYNKEYLLSFADAHYGKEFKSITNEYSIELVYDRFNRLLTEVVDIVNERGIRKLHILALGDLIEGMTLRVSQLNNLKIGMTQQTIQFMRFIVQWLRELSKYVEIVYYSTTLSNHTQIRPFGTKANQFEDEDVEKIIFAYIEDMFEANDRVTIVNSNEKFVMFKLFNYNLIATHGHKIKNIKTFLNDISAKYKTFFDYLVVAHHHHNSISTVGEGNNGNNCEVIKVPSIMGTDEYADDLLVGAKAGALLIEFTENQGKRLTYDIILN